MRGSERESIELRDVTDMPGEGRDEFVTVHSRIVGKGDGRFRVVLCLNTTGKLLLFPPRMARRVGEELTRLAMAAKRAEAQAAGSPVMAEEVKDKAAMVVSLVALCGLVWLVISTFEPKRVADALLLVSGLSLAGCLYGGAMAIGWGFRHVLSWIWK